MTRDHRYKIAKNLILGGYMKTMQELYDAVPKSVIAKDMGTNLARLNKMIEDASLYTFVDMIKIAALIEVDEMAIMTLVYNQYAADKKSRKKR